MSVLAGHLVPNQPVCCHQCIDAFHSRELTDWLLRSQFIVCDTCGNKRCPKATDCALKCTNSNEPGQRGSVYE